MLFCVCRTERRPPRGGKTRLFTEEQQAAIVQMVVENNTIRLCEIQQIIENHKPYSISELINLSPHS
jgi:transposase